MFKEIKFDDSSFTEYISDTGNTIENLSKINVFIGSNNSGKSRLLRRLYSNDNYEYISKHINKNEYNEKLGLTLSYINTHVRDNSDASKLELFEEILKKTYFSIYTSLNTRNTNHIIDQINHLFNEGSRATGPSRYRYNSTKLLNNMNGYKEENLDPLLNEIKSKDLQFKRYYIPILRSLRGIYPIDMNGYKSYTDNFRDLIVNTYFTEKQKDSIFTGLSLYDEVTQLLLGNTKDREKIRAFENFLSQSFFNGKDVNIVPRIKSTLHIKIGDEEYPIHDLGDGIQSIIILTYPLFFNQGENAIFFFEEPEIHLHPGFQRLFIETLQRKEFNSFQYFITTHSNHFLDITLDYNNISVYTLHKKEDDVAKIFHIKNVSVGDNSVLSLIGARTSSVFLSNCTIWVEGITDRIYLRKYLELYQETQPNKFKEDYHYSFVEYAGNNITHWSFLDSDDPNHSNINVERLCAKLFLITDKDGAGLKKDGTPSDKSTKKQERHKKLAEKLGDRYNCLNCREIENLLTKDIIKKIVVGREPIGTSISYDKFDKNDYSHEYLGKYIDDKITGKTKTYAYKNTTINKKPEFAKEATSYMQTFDDLSEEAKALTIRIYHFIRENNS